MTPEAKAGQTIHALLMPAGWHVCNVLDMSIYAGSRVAEGLSRQECLLNRSDGFADYFRYIDGKASDVFKVKTGRTP